MKFIKNIILILLIIFILYILWLFIVPNYTKKLGDTIWLEAFNNFILNTKTKLDQSSVWNFQATDLENAVNTTLSWATDIKNKAVDTVSWVKENIDNFRVWVTSTLETYEEVKWQVKDIKETIDKTTKKIQEVQWTINTVKNTFSSTGSIQ